MSDDAQVPASVSVEAPPTVLRAVGLRKSYAGPHGALTVLDGLDLEVRRGTFLAVMGASGSGKSTLLNILGTLDRADAGTLEIGGRNVEKLGEVERSRLRARQLGFVFQFHHLLPEFTAEENVMMPLRIVGTAEAESRARARDLLAAVGLSARTEHRPSELSGGEAQRVAVARALAPNPGIVLADEPSGNLDAAGAKELHNLLLTFARERHQTFVVVTHNDRLASAADLTLRLEDGRLLPA